MGLGQTDRLGEVLDPQREVGTVDREAGEQFGDGVGGAADRAGPVD